MSNVRAARALASARGLDGADARARASQTSYSFGPGTGNMTSFNQPVAVSRADSSILNVEVAPDGRVVHVVYDYHNDSRAGIFSLQPFFSEHVCFVFPPEQIPKQYDPFEIGIEARPSPAPPPRCPPPPCPPAPLFSRHCHWAHHGRGGAGARPEPR